MIAAGLLDHLKVATFQATTGASKPLACPSEFIGKPVRNDERFAAAIVCPQESEEHQVIRVGGDQAVHFGSGSRSGARASHVCEGGCV